MNKVVHAHVLLDFVQENPRITNLNELKIQFEKKFGETRFTNCTNQIYTFEEILDFLWQRKKIQYRSDGVVVNEENRCDHD